MTSGLLEIIHPEYDRVIIFKVNRPERVNEWVTDASNLYGIRNFKEHFPDVQEDRPENHQVEIVDKSKKNSSKGMWKLIGSPNNRMELRNPHKFKK